MTPVTVSEDLESFIERVSRSVRKQFNQMELADLSQEAWVWVFMNQKLVREHTENPGYLWQAARRHLVKYARRWLADAYGYDTDDAYYYTIPQLKALLTQAFTPEWHERGATYDSIQVSGGSGHSDPSEVWVMVADVKAGYQRLSQKDRDLLWQALGEPGDPKEHIKTLARLYGVTDNTLNQRVNDALNRLRRHLGGGRPRD